jgi:TPR repeat protein
LGYATEKNLELAKHWYTLASEKGHSIAIENLKDIS